MFVSHRIESQDSKKKNGMKFLPLSTPIALLYPPLAILERSETINCPVDSHSVLQTGSAQHSAETDTPIWK